MQSFVCVHVFGGLGKGYKVLYRHPVISSRCSLPGGLIVPFEMSLNFSHQRVENLVSFWVTWQYPTCWLDFIYCVAFLFVCLSSTCWRLTGRQWSFLPKEKKKYNKWTVLGHRISEQKKNLTNIYSDLFLRFQKSALCTSVPY